MKLVEHLRGLDTLGCLGLVAGSGLSHCHKFSVRFAGRTKLCTAVALLL